MGFQHHLSHRTMTVRKRGKTWQAQVRIKEHGKLVYSESATRDTKGAATLWKLQTMETIKAHGWRQRMTSSTTVAKLLEDWRDLRGKVKKLGRGFEHSVDTIIASELGPLTLPELTSAKVVAWAMTRHQAGNAPATVMHHLAMLSAGMRAAPALFNVETATAQKAVKDAIAQLKQLRVAAPSRRRDNRITEADLAKILPEFDSEQAVIPMAEIVRLAIALPRRREELLTMEWRHLTDDTIKLIDTKDPRKYREEIVPVPPSAGVLLAALPHVDDRVLPYKPESVSARWQRAVRRAGLAHLRFHDLRHEGISRLFEQGLSIEEVALISGHTSWATLRRYTHLRPQDVTEKLRNARR